FSKLSKYSRPDNFILHFSGLSDGLLPITPVDESQGILGYGSVKINSRFFKSDITLFKNSVSDSISEISINLPLLFIDRCFNILYSKVSFIKCVVTFLCKERCVFVGEDFPQENQSWQTGNDQTV